MTASVTSRVRAFRGLVAERGQLRGVDQFRLVHARDRDELGGDTVAEGDRAGLVQQQRIDVACRLDRAAGGCNDVETD